MSERLSTPENRLTEPQEISLRGICGRYNVGYDPEHYKPSFDLPEGYVCGYVGGLEIQREHPTIFVGCDPEGRISS